jgi:signal recognition particle receptor subunit beta
MAQLSADGTALTITVVVFGPSRSGKSAMLRSVHQRVGGARGSVTAPGTEQFVPLDWLPLDLGVIGGRHATVLLYAVPGLTAYDTTRRMVLNGADGVIFLADSQAIRLDENVEALRILRDHLAARDDEAASNVPIVFVYTKRDLPDELLVPREVLDNALRVGGSPTFAGDVLRGTGVREALQATLTLVLRRFAVSAEPDHG